MFKSFNEARLWRISKRVQDLRSLRRELRSSRGSFDLEIQRHKDVIQGEEARVEKMRCELQKAEARLRELRLNVEVDIEGIHEKKRIFCVTLRETVTREFKNVRWLARGLFPFSADRHLKQAIRDTREQSQRH